MQLPCSAQIHLPAYAIRAFVATNVYFDNAALDTVEIPHLLPDLSSVPTGDYSNILTSSFEAFVPCASQPNLIRLAEFIVLKNGFVSR